MNAQPHNLIPPAQSCSKGCSIGTGPGQALSPEAKAIGQRLTDANLAAESLLADWGVVLWSIRVKHGEIKLKAAPVRPVDRQALSRRFQEVLGNERPVTLKLKPLSSCCGKACVGCLRFSGCDPWLDALDRLV